jgi:mRNA interferase MazF
VVSAIRQGEVYWLDFGPPRGSAPAERHPCVVVQDDAFNSSSIATTVVCLITSNLDRGRAPGNVGLRKGEGGLPRASIVNVSQIFTVDKTGLEEQLGMLTRESVLRILGGLKLLFGTM